MAKKTIPKTWKQVCKVKGIEDAIPFNVSMLAKEMQNYLIAAYKLPIIIEIRNEGWFPNYNDMSQPKYELWPNVIADKEHPSGSGLSSCDFVDWLTSTSVGVRFCFKDWETAQSVFNDFKTEFEHFLLKIA